MNQTYFPTGNTTNGHTLVCMCCLESLPFLESEHKTPREIVHEMAKWMNENKYCTEAWQMERYMHECGYQNYRLDETDMGGGLSSLNTTPGMGPVTPPQGPGTNANFYNPAKQGSGDKFTSITVGTPAAQYSNKKKKKPGKSMTLQNFSDFMKAMKNLQ